MHDELLEVIEGRSPWTAIQVLLARAIRQFWPDASTVWRAARVALLSAPTGYVLDRARRQIAAGDPVTAEIFDITQDLWKVYIIEDRTATSRPNKVVVEIVDPIELWDVPYLLDVTLFNGPFPVAPEEMLEIDVKAILAAEPPPAARFTI
jgi:hypothetical protein